MKNIKKHITKIIVAALAILMSLALTAVAEEINGYINANGDLLPVYTLQKAGNDNENFVILLLGDGYTESEQDKLLEDLSVRGKAIIAKEPFRTYSDSINIYTVGTVSKESGVSIKENNKKKIVDTYFSIMNEGNIASFSGTGETKARAIIKAFEENFLDYGANIGTVHIVSNAKHRFGTSTSNMFSFSSMTDECSGGQAVIHEIAHSIGRLKDEYGRIYAGVNTSKTNNPESVPWTKMLGFRGMGITINDNQNPDNPTGYIPSKQCIMLSVDYNDEFCEVCKLELAKRLNSVNYIQTPAKYYVANPDFTLEHNYNTFWPEYNRTYRIINGNLIKANGKELELRTIVQNLTEEEHRVKLRMRIIDEFGNDKHYAEKEFVIPPLSPKEEYSTEYNYEPAKVSLSLKTSGFSKIVYRDTILGEVVDMEDNTVVATDKTSDQAYCAVNIHHKLKRSDGTIEQMPNTIATTVYVPQGAAYSPKIQKQLNGYFYIGNSLNGGTVSAVGESTDIDFYYEDIEPNIVTDVSSDKKTFTVKPNGIKDGAFIVLALYENGKLCDMKNFVYGNEPLTYTTNKNYSEAKVIVWQNFKNMRPICAAFNVV